MSNEQEADGGPNSPGRIYERLFGGAGRAGRTASAGSDASAAGSDASAGRAASAPRPVERRVLAVILATVDRDRVVADLGLPVQLLADDPLLGASVGLVRPADRDPIAILEPSSEGRLAATLARHGEELAGEYVEAPVGHDAIRVAATAAGLVLSRSADGPFGPSVLVLAGPVDGPHLVLVERPAGTIGR